jgi:hypothetical protein
VGAKQKKAREMWLACATQVEIAEAVGVDQKTIGNWEEDFRKSPEDGLFLNPPGFEPPIYNVWKQQTKTNAVSHFGNSEARWVENLLSLSLKAIFFNGFKGLHCCHFTVTYCHLLSLLTPHCGRKEKGASSLPASAPTVTQPNLLPLVSSALPALSLAW